MLVTPQNIQDCVAKICKEKLISLDTETTGLSETDKAFAVIIGTESDEYYFDFRSVDFVSYIQPILQDSNLTVVMQNAKFDIRMCESIGISIAARITDLASMSRLVRNDHFEGGYSLGAQAKRELGKSKGDDVIKQYIKSKGLYESRKDFFGVVHEQPRYDWVPLDMMHTYACLDARLTHDLYKHYLPLLDDKSVKLLKYESELIQVCYKMERCGLLLNKAHTIKAMYHENNICETAKASYLAHTTVKYTNSAKSIGKVLDYELPKTEDGNPSLTDDVIDAIISDGNPKDQKIANTVRIIRQYDKRVNTYYRSYLNLADNSNLIHPSMWIAGTRTGRFSYSDPNLQNIPKEEPTTYSIRECFMPRDGRTYVSFDYSQMEYRMLAAYANEERVITAVMNGADFHQATADMFGIPRKQAKTLNFAVLYGAGEEKLAGMLGVSRMEARTLKVKYFMALPRVERLVDSIISTGRSRGYVVNWAGRRLYAAKEFCYALPNHLIQGGGADVVKQAMIKINREFPNLLMVLQVHDQLVFELTDDEMKHVPRIKEIMESVFPAMNGMKLTVDVTTSKVSLAEKDMVKHA